MKILFLNPLIDAEHKVSKLLQSQGVALLFPLNTAETLQMLMLHGESVDLAIIHKEGIGPNADISGLELIKQLKSDPSYRDLPIILTSQIWGDTECATHQDGPTGVNAYLRSPFTDSQLIKMIEAVLGQPLIGSSGTSVTVVDTSFQKPNGQLNVPRDPSALDISGTVLQTSAQAPTLEEAPDDSRLILEAAGSIFSENEKKSVRDNVGITLESPDFNDSATAMPTATSVIANPTTGVDASGIEVIDAGSGADPGTGLGVDLGTALGITLGTGLAVGSDDGLELHEKLLVELSPPSDPGTSDPTVFNIDDGSLALAIPGAGVSGGPGDLDGGLSPILSTGLSMGEASRPALEIGTNGGQNQNLSQSKSEDQREGQSQEQEQDQTQEQMQVQEQELSLQEKLTELRKGKDHLPETDDPEVVQEMPYLFGRSKLDIPYLLAEPIGDAVVPGGAAQSPDIETFKKYLLLREQDVAALSNQLRATQDQMKLLDGTIREEKAKNAELGHVVLEQKGKIEEFDREKISIKESFETEANELKFQIKTKTDKARVLELQSNELVEEIDHLKERVRADIRKIRVREKELENRLEIMKKDSEALITARENKIIELKRKLDLLEFNMDLLQDQYSREKDNSAKLRDQLGRVAKVVRVADGLLDSNKGAVHDSENESN